MDIALWLAQRSPATILVIGMTLGVVCWEFAGVVAPFVGRTLWHALDREPRCMSQVRCGLGWHDYDYLQDLNAVVCWNCAKLAPPAIADRINRRNARLAGAE